MATAKKKTAKRVGTKSTKKAGTSPKVGRPSKAALKRSAAATRAWETRRKNAMHATNPG